MSDKINPLIERIERKGTDIGSEILKVSIADYSILIRGLSEDLKEKLKDRYEGFVTEDDREYDLDFQIFKGEGCFIEPSEDGLLKIEESEEKDRIYFLSSDFSGVVEKNFKSGKLILSSDLNETKRLLYGVENFLMRVFNLFALNDGGFFLHACGIVKDGKGYVFYGRSGSGKSALAVLTPQLKVLSDDLVLIIKKDGVYLVSSTPFWGAVSSAMKVFGVYEIRRAFHLIKSTETKIVKMDNVKAITTMFASALFGGFNPKRSNILFENIKSFVRCVEVDELSLPLEPVFWDMIS